MRVCVVGCGAIGSLFAAYLAQRDDVEVWAYDLYQGHVDAINARGLRLSGEGNVHSHPKATSNPDDIPPCEFGIVATKTLHTRAAIEATANVFKDGAVCSVQNGVGNEEIIAEYVPRVIRGTTFPAGRIVEPGHVQQDTGGKTWMGPFEPKSASMEEIEQLANALTESGMETLAMEDSRGAQWTKLIFNAATNPIGALTRLPHGIACDQPKVRALISTLVAEGVAVADAQGITLDSDPDALVDHAHKVAYNHKASMLQDALAERRTEVAALNGGIVEFGRKYDVPTPMHEAIWALIEGLEHSWTLED
ncbi:MAG: 2-dehydropantoate 2-reductase [Gammaproteobacteria bacterium]|nr:2-dehydropantoate 2-reductase [Gammaproteobacteria bacterium]